MGRGARPSSVIRALLDCFWLLSFKVNAPKPGARVVYAHDPGEPYSHSQSFPCWVLDNCLMGMVTSK